MKKFAFVLLFSLFCEVLVANDTLYFRLSNPVNTVKDPHGRYIRKCVIENGTCHVWDYNDRQVLVTESYYADTNFKKKLFCHKYFNEQSGWLEQTRCYENGRLDGYFVSYNKNGDTTYYDIYKEGQLVKSWRSNSAGGDSTLKVVVLNEVRAEFPGGQNGWLKFLGDNLRYPSSLQDKSINGEVIVTFVVSAEGNVEDVQIKKSLHPAFDKEAVRVVEKSPRWQPALQNSKKVPSRMTQTILF